MTDPLAALLSRLERCAPAPRGGDGAIAFAQPWQARLVAITVAATGEDGIDRFAAEISAAVARMEPDVAATPDGYYAAWLDALDTCAMRLPSAAEE